jgi:hypothetical protein
MTVQAASYILKQFITNNIIFIYLTGTPPLHAILLARRIFVPHPRVLQKTSFVLFNYQLYTCFRRLIADLFLWTVITPVL